MATAPQDPRLAPRRDTYREKLRADKSPGWRLRTCRAVMHYFALDEKTGDLAGLCHYGSSANVSRWIYRADRWAWRARQKRPCKCCLRLAPEPPPADAGSRPKPSRRRSVARGVQR